MVQAIADPYTIHALTRVHGAPMVLVDLSLMITKAMGYFHASRALSPMQVTLLAETLHEQYPHETFSDIALFLRRAAMGAYDGGKTYHGLDIPMLMRWWDMYMGEKAEAMEEAAKHQEGAEAAAIGGRILALPGVKEAVERMAMKRKAEAAEQGAIARRECLTAQVPSMTDKELRDAWGVYNHASERSMIQAEAARRGLLGEEFKQAQQAIDADQQ